MSVQTTGGLEVEGKRIPVSNLAKVLYPSIGFTKSDVIDYYIRIAPVLLPHLKGRALTLKRYPNGVEAEFFYEKTCPSHRPSWVDTVSVWSKTRNQDIPFCMVNNLASLVWAANLANLELHTFLSTCRNLSRPRWMVFDLDPGPPADILQCARVAIWLREKLKKFRLQSFPKTSGSKGLQVYVPLNTPVTFAKSRTFAEEMARWLEEEHPDLIVSKMTKSLRKGKVFIDWSQNHEHKTTVCVYSLRGKEKPTVSTPVTWPEVEKALRNQKQAQLSFLAKEVLDRVKKAGDLFLPVLRLKQRLPAFKRVA